MLALALAGALLLSGGARPDPYEGLVSRGIDLGREGRFEDAARAFDAALPSDPSPPGARGERGGLRFPGKRSGRAGGGLPGGPPLPGGRHTPPPPSHAPPPPGPAPE